MAHADHRPRRGTEGVRAFRTEDRPDFLSLYESVWDQERGAEWFEWRFEENPYADGVQMVVDEVDGRIVGAEPLLPFRLRVGEAVLDALQPADWMVHPAYRRRGHFTRMTEAVLQRYGDVDVLFNFPNDQIRPGLRSFDWRVVGGVPARYRVQRPRALVDDRPSTTAAAVARVSRPVLRRYAALCERRHSPPSDVVVGRYESVPVDTIRELYVSNRPDRVHVPRERAYLEWRFENPCWETSTFVAYRDGAAVASVVAATDPRADPVTTRLLDVQPMAAPGDERDGAVEALLAAVVSDAEGAALVAAPADCYPTVLRRHGFLRDDAFPLSTVSSVTTLAVRVPDPAASQPGADRECDETTGLTVAGRDLTDPDEWLLTPADRDVA